MTITEKAAERAGKLAVLLTNAQRRIEMLDSQLAGAEAELLAAVQRVSDLEAALRPFAEAYRAGDRCITGEHWERAAELCPSPLVRQCVAAG